MIYILLTCNLLMITTFLWRFSTLPPQIPLFYSKFTGEEQLGDTWMIFLLLILVNVLYFINDYVVKRFFSQNEFVRIIFKFLNVFVVVSLSLIFIKIVFLIS